MPINYRTFCFWARSNLSSVKRAGDRLGQLARTEIDVARWKLLAEIGDELVPALAYLTTVGINDTRTAEELEAENVAGSTGRSRRRPRLCARRAMRPGSGGSTPPVTGCSRRSTRSSKIRPRSSKANDRAHPQAVSRRRSGVRRIHLLGGFSHRPRRPPSGITTN